MKKIDASRFKTFKQERFGLLPKCRVAITFPGGTDCDISAVKDDGECLSIGHVANGHMFTEHFELTGFRELLLTSKKEMAADVRIRAVELEEPHDDRPPPEKVPADNILQQIRRTMRQELERIGGRESFIENNTGLAGYEIAEEDDGSTTSEMLHALSERSNAGPSDNDDADDVSDDPQDGPADPSPEPAES